MNRHPRQTKKGLRTGSVAAPLAMGGLALSAIAGPGRCNDQPGRQEGGRQDSQCANFGTVLVSGKTLYTLKPSRRPAPRACLKVWPALVLPKGVTKATAGRA